MEFAILGPVEARDDDRQVALAGPKQRAVLALLLLDANRPVSRDRLIDGLWGESPPASAGHTLDDYVSRLRRLLGADRIERRPSGYLIRVEPGELDLERFEALLERGRSAAAAGDAATASAVLGEALGLWRGGALAGLEYEPFAAPESERLEERRLFALEGRMEADLELGRDGELVGELEQLVGEHPFRERLLGQLMLSLYRAGRQADALAAYQAGRRRLAGELGLEPSPELQALEQRILEHDPRLAASTKGQESTPRRHLGRRSLAAAALAVAVVGASVAAGLELGTGTTSARALGSAPRLVELDPGSSAIAAAASLRDWPAAIAADQGSLWLAEPNASAVVRVDRSSRGVGAPIPVSGSPASVAVGGGAIWVASVPGSALRRIDPTTDSTTSVGLGGARVVALAFGLGKLWAADQTDAALLVVDPASGDVVHTLQLDVQPTGLAVGAGAIWVADDNDGLLERIDPRSGTRIPIRVGTGPVAVAVGDGAVWVANSLDATVSKVDPESDMVVPIQVGSHPVALAVRGGSVFVANERSSTVSRIDARSGRVTQTIAVGGAPTALVSAGGRIWVGTRALAAHRGGTLVLLHTRPLALDPALQTDLPPLQSNGLTYDALLTSPKVGGPQALQLIPDLAVSVPIPTDQQTTFTFRLRRGIRYSDGRLVRASDFRRAIERLFRVKSGWSGNYSSIVGAIACGAKRCDLRRGIETDDAAGTITFHLREPDPNFLSSMTSMGAAPVPPGTPFHDAGATPIPGTGPYIVASANKHEIRYVRNPHFHVWNADAQPDGNPDEIIMRYGLTPAQEVRAVERGQAHWTADGIPTAMLQREVTTRFPAQVQRLQTTETDFLQLNTTVPPFNDLRVRQALNFAIDRAAIVRLFGGPKAATPTCQILPPFVLGYRRYCPYTVNPGNGEWTGPDLARARQLVAASGTRGEQIVVWGASDGPIYETAVVPYTVDVLNRLGYRARAHLVPSSFFAHAKPRVFRTMQVTYPGTAGPTPYGFIGNWFRCHAFFNPHWFCDPHLDAAIQKANTVEATNIPAARVLWARIDHELVDRAAWVPLVNPHWIDFVSRHVHNYEADPNVGLIADQVWLR